MKKFLSIILATAILLSLIPVAFASDTTEISHVETYQFKASKDFPLALKSAPADYGPYIQREISGTTYNIGTTFHTGYGERRWRWLAVNDETIIKAGNLNSMVFRMRADQIQLQLDRDINGYQGDEPELALALAFESPDETAFYIPTLNGAYGTGIVDDIYLRKIGAESDISYYTDAKYVANTPEYSSGTKAFGINNVIYTSSEDEFVVGLTGINDEYNFTSLQLTKVLNPSLTLDKTSYTFNIGDEDSSNDSAIVSVTATGTWRLSATANPTNVSLEVAKEFLVYESDNQNVVKISIDGTLTAEGKGTTIVRAKTPDGKYSTEATVIVEGPAPEPDKALTNAFTPDDETDNYAYIAPSMTGLTIGGDFIDAELTANGYNIEAPAEDKEGDKFLYWAKGMETRKKIISFSNKLEGYVPENNGNNFIIAVYEGDIADTTTPEYYNIDGQLIAKSNTAPAYPSIPGLGTAEAWEDCGGNIKVAKYADMVRDNVTVTVEGGTGTKENVPYGTTITCTADPDTANFKCWKKEVNGVSEIVSVDSTYTFKAWETCTVEAVYEEHTPVSTAMKIIIDSFAVGSDTGVMAEFIGLDDAVEKGIMFTDSETEKTTKIAMSTKDNQFTVIADKEGTYTGYAILENATDGYQIITDGSYTKEQE